MRLAAQREAAARASKRYDGVRWLTIDGAIKASAGSGPSARQKRRMK